jgi:ABC-2 type transport system permease protein
MALLQPVVMDVWSAFDFIGALAGAGPGLTAEALYWSFTGALVSPVIAAYVIVQASGWVADLAQGRVEILLAGPVSWTRLVAGRLLAVTTGVLVITLASLGTLVASAAAIDSTVDGAGLCRLTVTSLLFGSALGSVAAIVVAWLRRGVAVTVLAVVVGTSYLIAYLVPFLDWPDWLNRLSVFWAFGQPYLQWPTTARLVVLLLLAVPGAVAAAAVAEHTPKVA